ncbi:hypothetical protein AJ85_14765 [Alkalihalobacillus alcalophilus ATCC 27647 = CGMCC 1.3604]|uniref:Uncharacterized protein n=1 Tax=Alkalihalobacillus alcalophilus ATCC 27647 = CGMCC 1.3604 TaxID=1218173 RepID=A0A094WJD3_ALKAL|nr:hypothetical protein [Alkalihalobacillus alcalophilus]KGA97889.1 hypothetical protein BALCAV_0207595 [Alkalihalobacillus alcalophilus ATCC 27647 = CGMCC 1.3604]MED1562136.1 hypothetical protein [Alkalihalobacillus alcalophilus]THG89864.1 hypothetical protein AJ85_14765 [Alkalihalobacillus alcalophilus ATCC 27647 = CGMCC 1.3604]
MYLYIFILPIIALLSMYAFLSAGWTVRNYEGKQVPYSLGVLVVFAYALVIDYFNLDLMALSTWALIYVLIIWGIGFIDDLYGQNSPKGIKGHINYLIKHKKPTTGILKIVGTIAASLYMTIFFEPETTFIMIRYFLLLLLFPHVMNALDTRPLRVWKVSLFFWFVLLLAGFIPSFLIVIYIVTVFYLLLVLEGHRIAMLGDNGATVIGSILALWTITVASPIVQWCILTVLIIVSGIIERISISAVIEKKPLLQWFDRLGVSMKKT